MDPVHDRPPTGSIPDAPGSYQFYDAEGRVLYVGKAKSLRHRLPNYWQKSAKLGPRTAQMVAQADHVEWVVVDSEVDALILEHSLIQAHLPRYNVRLKDDKSYPWLAVTLNEEWPRPAVVRGRKRKGVRYFGPYGNAGAIRSTLDLLVRSFPVRTCSDTKFTRHERLRRPCLLYDIDRCSGPCVGAVDHEAYDGYVNDLMGFLSGDTEPVLARLEAEMLTASEELQFERAARLRDRIIAVHKAAESQQMVSDRAEDFDVVGLAEDPLEASVQIFLVRRGRVVGHRGFVAEKVEDLSGPEFMAQVVAQVYGADGADVPRRLLVPEEPADRQLLQSWLHTIRGGPVDIAVPQRGAKRALQETVTRSAGEDLARHRLRRAADHNARSKALTELQSALSLREAPLRIECYDMSHLQGTDYVGSMVVFEDGLAKRSDYRRFKVKSVAGNDDYAAMEEVLTRRLTALQQPAEVPAAGRPRRFAYRPNLIVVDGGKGQLGVAERVVRELGLGDEVELASLAKQFEEVYRPGSPDPVRLRRGSDALYLLQRLRDEAHRFAITFHRERRGKRMTRSILDDIPGLGPARKARLVKELGGVNAVRAAPLEELLSRSWLPDDVGLAVFEATHNIGGEQRCRAQCCRAQGWRAMSEFVVVTGMSGAGRSTAAAALEDVGWFVIDNLPAGLIMKMVEMVDRPGSGIERVALVIGRGGANTGSEYFDDLPDVLDELRATRKRVRVVFLDAADDVLVRRYEGTRRRHPLAARGVEESIADERKLLEPVRERADLLVDTGELNSNQLRLRILEAFGDDEAPRMQTSVISFGYKHGIPLDVDVVFDCRFLPNPFWVEELRPFSGEDQPVRDYVLGQPESQAFLEKVDDLLTSILPAFTREGKSYLTIAMGCTGGRHRSVTLARELATRLSAHGEPVSVFHRDIDR